MENIIEKNIQFAKFLGWKIDNSFPDKNRVWRLGNRIELDSTLKFHLSMDELIKVVDKIETIKYVDSSFTVNIYGNCCSIQPIFEHFDNFYGEDKLEATYLACCRFVEFYNKNFNY